MYTGPSKLQNLAADFFERAEIKKFLAVVSEVSSGAVRALHTVRSCQLPGGRITYHQVVADKIEMVAVEPCTVRAVEPLSKLAIKDQIAQPLACDDIFQRVGHPHPEEVGGGKWIPAVVHQDSRVWHESSFKRSRLLECFRDVFWMAPRVTDGIQRAGCWVPQAALQYLRLLIFFCVSRTPTSGWPATFEWVARR